MDRPISQDSKRNDSLKKWGGYIVGIALLAAAIWAVRQYIKPSMDTSKFRIAKAVLGPMNETITSSGTVVPAFESVITSPITAEILTVKAKPGTTVDRGSEILELNTEFTKLEVAQLKDELELRKNNVTRLTLEFDKNLRDLELDDQIQGLQVNSLEALLEDAKKLNQIGGATDEEVEKASLDLQIANLQKKKLENEVGFRKASLNSDKKNLELEVQIQQNRLAELNKKLYASSVIAKQAGVVTWVNENIGAKVNEGEPLVRIANLDNYYIEGQVSDRYAQRISPGMEVTVRINRKEIPGVIQNILPEINNNVMKFNVILKDGSDTALRPQARVEVFLITNQKAETLKLPAGPAFTGANTQDVYVIRNGVAEKIRVSVGMSSIDEVEITSGLQPGDRVIISKMDEYEHLDRIELENQK